MLELNEAAGAFGRLEEYLADEGFWARGDAVADLYLGYGLSAALRRTAAAAPPEPCPLPLLACAIRPERRRPAPPGRCAVGGWERTWDDAAYAEAIESVRAAIARGDVYQVNLVQHLSAPFDGDPGGSRRRARAAAAAPAAGRCSAAAGRSYRRRPSSFSPVAATGS